MDQIELYRETRESIMQGLEVEAWNNMPYAARDRAMLAELKAENNLHPALHPPSDSSAVLGHYKVDCQEGYREDLIKTTWLWKGLGGVRWGWGEEGGPYAGYLRA